jgi:uronate dehydrogenase
MKKLLLVTGAAGNVARMLRPLMRADWRLRLSDLQPIKDVVDGEESVPADLADLAAVERAVRGVDGILHLGGFSVEGPWATILEANIVGAYNLFEAARRAGVKRVVFASSNHAVGFHRRDDTIGVDARVRPDTRYGLSKAFGEALASLYADKYGLETMSIRIGNVAERPIDRRRLGYAPRDRSEDHAAAILAADPPRPGSDDPAELYQGGTFVATETGGDPLKPHLG